MTKADLIDAIAGKANVTKVVADRSLRAFLEAVTMCLVKDDKLTLAGLGTFVVENRKARQGRNPRTGEALIIPASKVVKFRPGKQLKESLN